jgi:hypothetical protein
LTTLAVCHLSISALVGAAEPSPVSDLSRH